MMKGVVLFLLFLAIPFHAQNAANSDPESACGPRDPKLKVEISKENTPLTSPSDKATVVFVEDQLVARPGAATCMHCDVPTLLGMDGRWIAGGLGMSHMSVSVEPGDHHFCSRVNLGGTYLPAMFGLRVEAGKTYFLIGKLSIAVGTKSDILELSLANEDEGRYLVSSSKQSVLMQK